MPSHPLKVAETQAEAVRLVVQVQHLGCRVGIEPDFFLAGEMHDPDFRIRVVEFDDRRDAKIQDRKSTRLNSSHGMSSRMPSSA